jgi:hypothetical protein
MLDFIMICYTTYICGAFLGRKKDMRVFEASRGFYIFIGMFYAILKWGVL